MEVSEARRKFVELTEEKRKKEAEVRTINSELGRLQEIILLDFSESGMSSCHIDGMVLYMTETPTVSVVDKDGLRKALMSNDLEDLLSCNCNTLRALVKSYEEESGRPLPEDIRAAIRVDSIFKLCARKG